MRQTQSRQSKSRGAGGTHTHTHTRSRVRDMHPRGVRNQIAHVVLCKCMYPPYLILPCSNYHAAHNSLIRILWIHRCAHTCKHRDGCTVVLQQARLHQCPMHTCQMNSVSLTSGQQRVSVLDQEEEVTAYNVRMHPIQCDECVQVEGSDMIATPSLKWNCCMRSRTNLHKLADMCTNGRASAGSP